jgi:hypothetical protein
MRSVIEIAILIGFYVVIRLVMLAIGEKIEANEFLEKCRRMSR